MATKTNRLGETRMMNCGMKAAIIRYGKYTDIDVRFEDGAIAKCRGYKEFKKVVLPIQILKPLVLVKFE